MALPAGTRLGPYEIVSPIGAGGMGEVYRAKDTRLDRTVAIKVLPPHLSSDPDHRQRFEREARTISSLNHPHICTLHDIGHQDGTDYLVMEYLEGETLDHRLAKGPLPTDQVLRYSIEIADALDKAHRQGVIHRDLKPGNIMLTKSGAKLLDFGLAKLKEIESGQIVANLSALPTEGGRALTAEGTILGTFQYMAPEQLEGKQADTRTDIFAFGVVVYEMATGRKPFEGKSQASLISAIMSSEPPPISTVQPLAPAMLDRVVKTCLAKDPDERWQNAHDLNNELKWVVEGRSQAAIPVPAVLQRKSRERLWMASSVLLVLVVVALATIAYFQRGAKEAPANLRLSIEPPEKVSFSPVYNGPIAISPDGRRLAFLAVGNDGQRRLWTRSLDSLSAQPLSGTDGALFPFWSPDSRFLGFFSGGKLKRIDLSGGPPQALCEAVDGRAGAWSREGIILFAPGIRAPLYRIPAAGGEATPATELDQARHEVFHRVSSFLPDGRHFLFLAVAGREDYSIHVGSLDSKERKRLLNTDSLALFSPPGYLVFIRQQVLLAQQFDYKRLEVKGEPIALAENVEYYQPRAVGNFSVSNEGILVYLASSTRNSQLTWFDREGKQLGPIGQAGSYTQPELSPDGSRVVFEQPDPRLGSLDIWLMGLARGASSRFTFDPTNEYRPIWSPDGATIVFTSSKTGGLSLFQKASNGTGSDTLVLKSSVFVFPTDWSRDGRFILYENQDPKTKWDLWVLPTFGDKKPRVLIQSEFNEVMAKLSPDGKWVAYVSDESGRLEVYVRSFPTAEGKWLVSTDGGSQPRWRRDGRELYFLSNDRKLMAVEVKQSSTFEASTPRALFNLRIPQPGGLTDYSYDVTADGRRFLVNAVAGEAVPSPITVVVNWTAGLKR